MNDVAHQVSVVIPTHNRAGLLQRAVASVLAQAETAEVVVVDDGSDPPVAATGVLADERVVLVRNEIPLGPSRARNVGLDRATRGFVAFLDDDDMWLPGKLAAGLKAMEAHPGAVVVAHRTAFAVPAQTGNAGPVSLLTDPLEYFGTHQTPHPDSLLVRRSRAGNLRFADDLAAAEDVDFAIELGRIGPFAMIDRVLAVHGDDDAPTAIGLEKRVAARKELRRRHGDVLYATNAARAFYHVRLGHLLRGVSRWQAMGSFATALRYAPGSRLAWRGMLATLLPADWARRLSTVRRGGGA